MPGAPSGYNANLSLFCRADGDVFSFYSGANSTVVFANNAVVTYTAVPFDLSCLSMGTCGSTPYVFRNNIVLGLLNTTPRYAANGNDGTSELPALWLPEWTRPTWWLTTTTFFTTFAAGLCPSLGECLRRPALRQRARPHVDRRSVARQFRLPAVIRQPGDRRRRRHPRADDQLQRPAGRQPSRHRRLLTTVEVPLTAENGPKARFVPRGAAKIPLPGEVLAGPTAGRC